jgi:CelD/BcsL family acetyltransferase involved in cellulose biosynthesis
VAVRVVTSEAEFDALKPLWQELFRSNPNHTPFQSWEWNFAWWKHFGKAGQLRLLIVEQDGQSVGIAPFRINLRYEGAPLRHLAFISRKRADYLDFIVTPGTESLFFTELFAFLHERKSEYPMLELREFPENSVNLPYLLQSGTGSFPYLSLQRAENCATLMLPSKWEEYLALLGKSARRNVGRYRRRLTEEFAMSWKAPEAAEEIQGCFDDFASVYRSRWRNVHGATLFDESRSLAFERELCNLASAAGWYRFYLLYLDGAPVAGYLGYVCNNKYFAGLLAYLPAMQKHSVGSVLIGLSVEDCINKGFSEFDMTRGDEPYKHQWNCSLKHNYLIKLSHSRRTLTYASWIEWFRGRLVAMKSLHQLRASLRRRFTKQAKPDETGISTDT